MHPFQFSTVGTIIHEIGAAKRIADLCAQQNCARAMIITDAGILKAGLLSPCLEQFSAAGLYCNVFDQVEADPADKIVELAAREARQSAADIIIGFGGGSSMDVAKLVAVLAHPSTEQALSSMYGIAQITSPSLPLIQVPTTAGTGSEVTPIAIITTGENSKAGIVSTRLLPTIALLDAELSLGLPAHITAATGIDAMVHAIEAYTSKIKKNPVSDMFAKQALRLLSDNIVSVVQDGSRLENRANMLLGSMYAGQAFANAPVAAVHALAYPLGGYFHIPHGLSNALVLPHVLRFNLDAAPDLYAELAELISPTKETMQTLNPAERLVSYFENLTLTLGLPSRLRDCGVSESSLPLLAAEAMKQERLLVNNPKRLSEHDALQIYLSAY